MRAHHSYEVENEGVGYFSFSRDALQAAIIAVVVFLLRYLTRGDVYYVDGPILVKCIEDKTFIIQPPGYWLFAHLGGLFHDPAFGLLFVNQLFSAFGVAVFFLLCLELRISRPVAWSATAAYATVFYVWLAGDIHSSYASQILFPSLLVYLFLRYSRSRSRWLLVCCSMVYAIGAGLRPSDGAFIGPLFLYMVFRYVGGLSRRVAVLGMTATFCLLWFIPNQLALHAAKTPTYQFQVGFAKEVSPLFVGINSRSIANTLRVLLPLFAAFWALLPSVFLRPRMRTLLLLWISPGLAFMLCVFMADPVYLSFMTAAILLYAALSLNPRTASILLTTCAIANTILFLFAVPLPRSGPAEQALNFYVIKYSLYGIKHQWTSTIGSGGFIP